ncbi:MAG: UDP-2,3-diacylglucosamine diphosphatase, partial [Pseudoxanthomonas sp.]
AALASLHEHGVPCFFIHGNRDFLLGDDYARRARITFLPDPSVVEIQGKRILIAHGDMLCTDDAPYQSFRKLSHAAAWQRTFLATSPSERRIFAENARSESRKYTQEVDNTITDVNSRSVTAALDFHRVSTLIHGHTHRPAVHHVRSRSLDLQRIVLGDWYEHGSVVRGILGKFSLFSLKDSIEQGRAGNNLPAPPND